MARAARGTSNESTSLASGLLARVAIMPRTLSTSIILALTCACGWRTASTSKSDVEQAAAPEPEASVAAPDEAPERVAVRVTAVDQLEVAFKRAIDRAGPAVVSIYTTKTMRSPFSGGPFGDPLFEQFFGLPHGQNQEFMQRGLGSGFIIDTSGHVLTNYHVIADADAVNVELADGREFDAELVGADPPTDLALLKISADDLHPVELGHSSAVEVGDWVVAIGNPYGLPQTVSVGIVSAKGRANVGIIDFEDFIQTDAAVNPGNSGGPLVDLEGRVVAISTAIASRGGGNEGIAFAIPVDMVKTVVDQLLSEGKVTRGNLGVMISELSEELAATFDYEAKGGILIQDVIPDSAASKAGLREGDIIVDLDGQPVTTVAKFRAAIASRKPNTKVELGIWREGKSQKLEVTLGEAPTQELPRPDARRPRLGVGLADVSAKLQRQYGLDEAGGVVITDVLPGSAAASAGLREGDLLEQIGDTKVESAAQAVKLLRGIKPSERVRLRIRRRGVGSYVLIEPR